MADALEQRVRILGLRLAKRAEDGNRDAGLVAIFDAKIPSMTLFGATLYRRRDGQMTASPPRGQRGDGTSNGVRIDDAEIKAELCAAACAVAAIFGADVTPGPELWHGFSEVGAKLLDPSHIEHDEP